MNNKVREYRKKRKMSQEKLAEISGISRTTLSDIECQKKTVTTNLTMQKIADALGVKVTTIFYV